MSATDPGRDDDVDGPHVPPPGPAASTPDTADLALPVQASGVGPPPGLGAVAPPDLGDTPPPVIPAVTTPLTPTQAQPSSPAPTGRGASFPPGITPVSRDQPPLSRLVGRRPVRGAAPAAKTVIDDVRTLVKAEVALAKAELTTGIKSKVLGAGLFIGVAVIGWLAIQVFLVFLGFLFALFLPGWAAVGLVLLLLVIMMGVLGYLGYRKLRAEANLTTTKDTVEHSKSSASAAVSQLQQNVKTEVQETKDEAKVAAKDVVERLKERVSQVTGRGQN